MEDTEYLLCSCRHKLCSYDKLCFYEQTPGAWHLIVIPELKGESLFILEPVLGKKSAYTPNLFRCPGCRHTVGKETLIGPRKEAFLCFNIRALRFAVSQERSSWLKVKPALPWIATWSFCSDSSEVHSSYSQPFRHPKEVDFRNADISRLSWTTPRNYQVELFVRAAWEDSLVVLPTGSGKTLVAVMVMNFLKTLNEGKTGIFLADRIPLVHQQAKVLGDEGGLKVKVITGEDDRVVDKMFVEQICLEHDVVALTAQCFLNILDWDWLQVSQCYLIVFDEAHHAAGRHSYSRIMEKVKRCPAASRPRILGLTASLGGELSRTKTTEKISELCSIYGGCSVFTPFLFSNELKEIYSETATKFSFVNYTAAETKLQEDLWEHLISLWSSFYNETSGDVVNLGVSKVLRTLRDRKLEAQFSKSLSDLRTDRLNENREDVRRLVEYTESVRRIIHESDIDGVVPIKERLLNIVLTGDVPTLNQVPSFLTITHEDRRRGTVSSRVEVLLKEIREVILSSPYSRIVVFVQTRDKAHHLVSTLEKIPDIASLRPSRLVGHSGFHGMTWMQEQKPTLQRFRSGIVRLLISTSVLEEGLDVPSCNAVIRFDGMVSLTRMVQSRGRARHRESQFVVLLREEEWLDSQKVREQELSMLASLQSYSCQTSVSRPWKSVLEYLTRPQERNAALDSKVTEEFVDQNDEDQVEFCPEHSYAIKMKHQSTSLKESFLKETLSGFAHVLKCDMKLSLVSLRAYEGQDSFVSYQNLCTKAIPLLQSSGHHLWLQNCSWTSLPSLSESVGTYYLDEIALGYFEDPSTFFRACSLNSHVARTQCTDPAHVMSLIVDRGENMVLLSAPGRSIMFEFPVAAIFEWVLVHHDVDSQSQRFYIPLQQAPRVYSSYGHRLSANADHEDSSVINFLNRVGGFFVYELVFTVSDGTLNYIRVTEFLKTNGVLIHDSKITDLVKDAQELQIKTHKHMHLSFSTAYLMKCIFSQYGYHHEWALDRFQKVLQDYSLSKQQYALQTIVGQIDWFCDPCALLSRKLRELPTFEKFRPDFALKNHVLVRCATVTPTRIICHEPQIIKSSRMLRHFSADLFLKVSFREENMGFLYGGEQQLLVRVRWILKNGLIIANRRFRFLGSSSSMLRAHSCWMTSVDPREVREWLGNFSKIRCVGKYMARVGLGMASSDVTISVDKEVVDYPIEDVEVGNSCFSDGVGKISQDCLSQVLHFLPARDNYRHTSALQVRIGGYKGVLALDPTLSSEGRSCVLRKSMFKFPCRHMELEVLSSVTSQPVYLNRQSIVLLSSLGIRDSVFHGLQEQQLQNLLTLFTEYQGRKEIFGCCQELQFQAICCDSLHIQNEPFLKNLLKAVYNQKAKALVEKTHILVSEGRLLMGVLDETFSLNYGEVFVQLCDSSTNREMKIIQGSCVAYKNPCFHPGDVRKLHARDVQSLHHLVNCVVFPAKGKRPHPKEMSGSDLDGDMYSVIWLPDLIPQSDVEPLSYDVGLAREVPVVKENDMIDFFVNTIQNVQLGRIANAHLALSDLRAAGALDKDCIKLAELHATAVDFPKTGLEVHIPEELIPKLWPDFMGKRKKLCYESDKVIGQLYRRARSIFGEECHDYVHLQVKPDISFLVKGFEEFKDDAKKTYKHYCALMHGLMQCYGIQNEEEIITGCILRMHDHLSSEVVEWTKIVKQQYKVLLKSFREEFEEQCQLSPDCRSQMASAWYWAAYSDEDQEHRCLSFPWIVARFIRNLDSSNGTVREESHGDTKFLPCLGESITETMLMDFSERQPYVFASLLEREDLCEKVEMCIKAGLKDVSVEIFGSSSTFLFEPDWSDLDLCIHKGAEGLNSFCDPSMSIQSQKKTLRAVLPRLKQDFPGIYYISNASVPILKYCGILPFDLTANSNGLKKRNIISSCCYSYPALLLLLTVVTRWARLVGLAGHAPQKQITPFGLSWLLIQFCLKEQFISELDVVDHLVRGKPSTWLICVIEELMDPTPSVKNRFARGTLPGDVLLKFFQELSDPKLKSLPGSRGAPFSVPDPIAVPTCLCIDMDENLRVNFQNRCLQAWHALACTRTVKSLFSLGERLVSLRLSRMQSALFRGSEEFYAQSLSLQSGGKAKVRIFSRHQSHNHRPRGFIPLQIEIQGDPAAVKFIQRQLQEMNCGVPHRTLTFGRLNFVKGATCLLFEGSVSDTDLVGFHHYQGGSHLKHASCDRRVPVLVAPVGGLDWRFHARAKLRVSVWHQRQLLLEMLQSDTSIFDHRTLQLRALIQFGTLYVSNLRWGLGDSMG